MELEDKLSVEDAKEFNLSEGCKYIYITQTEIKIFFTRNYKLGCANKVSVDRNFAIATPS